MPLAANWDVNHPLVLSDLAAELLATRAIALHHVQYPFVGRVAESQQGSKEVSSGGLRQFAASYLNRVRNRFELAKHEGNGAWSKNHLGDKSLAFDSGFEMTWLDRGEVLGGSSLLSRLDDAKQVADRSLVIFLTQSVTAKESTLVTGSGIGLRIDATLHALGGNEFLVKIIGSSCSSALRSYTVSTDAALTSSCEQFAALTSSRTRSDYQEFFSKAVAVAGGLDFPHVHLDGIRVLPQEQAESMLEWEGHLSRPSVTSLAPAYRLTTRIAFNRNGLIRVWPPQREPLVAHGTATAGLFNYKTAPYANGDLVDPTSQAADVVAAPPNRSREILNDYRSGVELSGINNLSDELLDPSGWFMVAQSRLVDPKHADESKPHRCVPDPGSGDILSVRSADFAAAGAYVQTWEMLNKIDSFGLVRADFFKFGICPDPLNPDPAMRVPLLVRYRATLFQGVGRDGIAVNAQVDFDPPDTIHKPLQMRYALADVKRTTARDDLMGLAADPRWSWHEFCHVLMAGATGKLELPYVHSAGDALAAIACDPRSRLTIDPKHHKGELMPPLRGLTFPWAVIGRRHDRSVQLGWSWSGTYHRAARFDSANANRQHKGYDSEQILSTTLFRLYRALGGDALASNNKADIKARQAASDYTVYLIMRAIASLGSAQVFQPERVEGLQSLLGVADVATQRIHSGVLKGRVGGCAHKVIRWAFEAQGLFAGVAAEVIHDAPGEPPPVDVYIDNRRPRSEGSHERGGYMPVSLDWFSTPAQWHASAQAMEVVNGSLRVTVSNRGSAPATGVTVQVWYTKWIGTANLPPSSWKNPPDWNRAKWTRAAVQGNSAQTIGPAQSQQFNGFALPVASGRYLVLAEANANEDLAVIHNNAQSPDDDLPCAAGDTSIVQVVAGDNNLGLMVYRAP